MEEVIKSNSVRGKEILVIGGYTYRKKTLLKKSGQVLWTCTIKSCRAKILTEGDDPPRVTRTENEHNHCSRSIQKTNRRIISAIAKQKAKEDANQAPSKIITSSTSEFASRLKTLSANDIRCIRRSIYFCRKNSRHENSEGRNGDGRLPCGEMSPSEDVSGLWQYHSALGVKKATPPTPRELSSPVTIQETGSVHDETSSSGNKDDDDDDDEEIDDLKTLPHDPERLKAFNMFVRLFVDENLDRIVPISKQPKEKIQAIIDSCTRQFPEFAERARKRIRTYLKSCRRNKRTRDSNWPDSARPTPAHLTSVQAEQILAQACENESHNAKRMRIGLEPISQPMPVIPGSEPVNTRPVDTFSSTTVTPSSGSTTDSSKQHLIHLNNNKPESPNLAKATEASNVSLSSLSGSPLNGATGSTVQPNLYRANFNQSFQRTGPAPHPYPGSALFPAPPFGSASMMPNGPTDLSMKASSKPLLSHKLNPTEIAAVRQLITGYRESAAFLLRSADELEHLLLQQP